MKRKDSRQLLLFPLSDQEKCCTKCGVVKPLSQFYKRTDQPGKYKSECIECYLKRTSSSDVLLQRRVRYHRNPEPLRAKQNDYAAKHREREAARARKWRADFPERVRSLNQTFYALNREEQLAQKREAHRLNPAPGRAHARKRAAQIRGAKICDLTAAHWQALLEEFDFACGYCNRRLDSLTQDHLTPVSRGGDHTASNIVPACADCNMAKHDKTLFEYLRLVQGQFPRPEPKDIAAD